MVLTNGDLVPPNPRPTLLTLFALFLTFKAGGFQMWSCERPKEGIQIRKRERRQLRERQVGGMRRENGGGGGLWSGSTKILFVFSRNEPEQSYWHLGSLSQMYLSSVWTPVQPSTMLGHSVGSWCRGDHRCSVWPCVHIFLPPWTAQSTVEKYVWLV